MPVESVPVVSVGVSAHYRGLDVIVHMLASLKGVLFRDVIPEPGMAKSILCLITPLTFALSDFRVPIE